MDIIQTLAQELDKNPQHVENVVRLLDEGNTIPFIARYRKELHGAMDDTVPADAGGAAPVPAEPGGTPRDGEKGHRGAGQADGGAVRRHRQRQDAGGGGGSLPPLQAEAPHPRHRRHGKRDWSRWPQLLLAQEQDCPAPEDAAQAFIDPEKGVETVADALQGANDIIAETLISDDADIRKTLRGAADAAGPSPQPGRHGGGQRVPAVLRL